jgi:hypothetical protein
VLLAMAGSLVVASAARAENIQVSVVAILATARNKHVDEHIKCVAEAVRKQEPSWTGFQEVRTTRKSLPVGEQAAFPLVDDRVVHVRVDSGCTKDNWVGLTLQGTGLGELTYSVRCGRCVPIRTPYYTKDRDRLFLAVTVKPCSKGK